MQNVTVANDLIPSADIQLASVSKTETVSAGEQPAETVQPERDSISEVPRPRIIIRPEMSGFLKTTQAGQDQAPDKAVVSLINSLVSDGQPVEIVYVLSGSGQEMTEKAVDSAISVNNPPVTSEVGDINEGIRLNRSYRMVKPATDNQQDNVLTPAAVQQDTREIDASSETEKTVTGVIKAGTSENTPEFFQAVDEAAYPLQADDISESTVKTVFSDRQSVTLTAGTGDDQSPSVSVPGTGIISPSRSDDAYRPVTGFRFAKTEPADKVATIPELPQAPSFTTATGQDTGINVENAHDAERESSSPVIPLSRIGMTAGKPDNAVSVTDDNVPLSGTGTDTKPVTAGSAAENSEIETVLSTDQQETDAVAQKTATVSPEKNAAYTEVLSTYDTVKEIGVVADSEKIQKSYRPAFIREVTFHESHETVIEPGVTSSPDLETQTKDSSKAMSPPLKTEGQVSSDENAAERVDSGLAAKTSRPVGENNSNYRPVTTSDPIPNQANFHLNGVMTHL